MMGDHIIRLCETRYFARCWRQLPNLQSGISHADWACVCAAQAAHGHKDGN